MGCNVSGEIVPYEDVVVVKQNTNTQVVLVPKVLDPNPSKNIYFSSLKTHYIL